MSETAYEIDQHTAACLADLWVKEGMPDSIVVYDPATDMVTFRDRMEIVADMAFKGIPVPEGIQIPAQLAQPPMLTCFWVAVLLPHGVQYARVSTLDNGAEA